MSFFKSIKFKMSLVVATLLTLMFFMAPTLLRQVEEDTFSVFNEKSKQEQAGLLTALIYQTFNNINSTVSPFLLLQTNLSPLFETDKLKQNDWQKEIKPLVDNLYFKNGVAAWFTFNEFGNFLFEYKTIELAVDPNTNANLKNLVEKTLDSISSTNAIVKDSNNMPYFAISFVSNNSSGEFSHLHVVLIDVKNVVENLSKFSKNHVSLHVGKKEYLSDGTEKFAEASYLDNDNKFMNLNDKIFFQRNVDLDAKIFEDKASLTFFIEADDIYQKRQQNRKEVGIIFALFFIFTISSVIYAIFILLKPLTKLSNLTKSIGDGNFEQRAPAGKSQEIHYLSRSLNRMLDSIEEFTKKIKLQSKDLNTMLDNLSQGVMTLSHDLKIHKEYSKYLETIIEKTNLADKDIFAVLLSKTNMSSDRLDQTKNALLSCLGEGSIAFELNQDLFPKEVSLLFGDDRVKHLELEWNPIDLDDIIVSFLVTVRDITELKALKEQAQTKSEELETIGNILHKPQNVFQSYLQNTQHLLEKTTKTLHLPTVTDKNIAQAMVYLHTIKGNSRSYGFQRIARAAHDTEDALKNLPTLENWANQIQMIIPAISSVAKEVVHLEDLYKRTIASFTSGDFQNAGAADDILKEHIVKFLPVIDEKMKDYRPALNIILGLLFELYDGLFLISLEKCLESVPDFIFRLAKELHKGNAKFHIKDSAILFPIEIMGVLKDIFTHLVQNSMDHGIESKEERLAAGKSIEGNIHVEAAIDLQKQILIVRYFDDGRGLNFSAIKKKAIANGQAKPDENYSNEQIAEFLFQSGFSTKEAVTSVSGRGVGMDAVRSFVEDYQGQIKIELNDADQVSGGRPFSFKFSIQLPKNEYFLFRYRNLT